jgi:hypothetical protein
VLTVVHHFTDCGVGISNQNQIHAGGFCRRLGFSQGHNAHLLAFGTYEADRVRGNLVVRQRLLGGTFAVSLNADSPLIHCNTATLRNIFGKERFKRIEIHGSQVLTATRTHGHLVRFDFFIPYHE